MESMTVESIKQKMNAHSNDIAFIIGNGINRYQTNSKMLPWDSLLISLWKRVTNSSITQIPQGISLTEFYDILDLENQQNIDIQLEVANLMFSWEVLPHHTQIVRRIREFNVPILTTNFERTFANTLSFGPKKMDNKGFTDFYPWSVYHSDLTLELPTDGFGIWHINGMINYRRSIRLGLSHYMGSVERARGLIHNNDEDNLFTGKNVSYWKGCKTWLHIIFNKSLFIFGLSLEENETFLRWLLIERMKYFKKFPARKHNGWYLKAKEEGLSEGKKLFLEKIGFEILEVDTYKDIYSNMWK